MKQALGIWLQIKSRLVGTPLEGAAQRARWLLKARKRHKHPELWELYLEEHWLPVILQRLLKNDSRCVDAGCHIGSFLSLLANYAPNGRHVAFEPSMTKSAWLKRQFPQAEIFSYALGDASGVAVFEEDFANPGYSHLQQDSGGSAARSVARYEVQVRRLDDILLEGEKVDFIKLDIEGSELAALRGATKLMKKWRPAIMFECGTEYHSSERRKELYSFVTDDLGYEVFSFTDFVFHKGKLSFDEFRKCGLYPFRAFNFLAFAQPDSIS
jgi:FkbM family methyltransferase